MQNMREIQKSKFTLASLPAGLKHTDLRPLLVAAALDSSSPHPSHTRRGKDPLTAVQQPRQGARCRRLNDHWQDRQADFTALAFPASGHRIAGISRELCSTRAGVVDETGTRADNRMPDVVDVG